MVKAKIRFGSVRLGVPTTVGFDTTPVVGLNWMVEFNPMHSEWLKMLYACTMTLNPRRSLFPIGMNFAKVMSKLVTCGSSSRPPPDAQAIPAFQRTLQRLDVATAGSSKRFHGVKNTLRVGAVHVGEFALRGRLID
jgi:hypothetical protein